MTDKPQFVGKKVTIGELGKTQSGGTPSSKHPEFFNGSIPWIGTTALNGKFLGKNDAVKLITEEAVAKSATKIVPEKSIMVGIRVGVGKVAINAVPMCTSQDIVSIVGIDEASWNKEYISLALQYKAPLLAAQAQGATIAGITSKTLKAIEIPAIPINEQNRVVDILRKLENQVGFVRKQLCGLDALVKSRFVAQQQIEKLQMLYDSLAQEYFGD
ncbi:restriction endonuclease subunit S [Bifidobacterium adolescentis]|uniref:restriction endonuclease subunit S n=1 Tax=Bifidobacterium adolescentis TaxID=1680 RepID=UPI0032BF3D6C